MGVACQIIRDRNSNIIEVEAPNGEPSSLYKNLLDITKDTEKALDLWAYTYTDEFKNNEIAPLDYNGEYTWDTVMKHLNIVNADNSNVDAESLVDLMETFRYSGVETFSTALNILNAGFYKDGLFVPDPKYLRNIYTEDEIKNILNDVKLQSSINNVLIKLNSQELKKAENEIYIPNSSTDLTVPAFTVNNLGKTPRIDVSNIQSLVGIEDKVEFSKAIDKTGIEELIEYSKNSREFFDSLFNFYSKKMLIEEVRPDMSPIYKDDIRETIVNTAFPINTVGIDLDISTISSIEGGVWNDSMDEIKVVLDDIVERVAESGIDLTDINLEVHTRDEVVTLLNAVNTLLKEIAEGDISNETLNNFADAYNSIFDIQQEVAMHIVDKSDATLFKIHTVLSEEEMLSQYSLLKVGEFLYQKVNTQIDIYEDIYNTMIEGNDVIVPQVAFFPFAYTNGVFNAEKVLNPKNKDVVMEHMRRWANKGTENEVQANIKLLRTSFGHKYKSPITIPENNLLYYFNQGNLSNEAYLTGKFYNDLQVETIKQKKLNSPIYKALLSKLKVTDAGLVLTDVSPGTMWIINSITPTTGIYKQIRDYTYLSKNTLSNLNMLFKNPLSIVEKTIPYLRNFYLNNPKAVYRYTGDVIYSEGKAYINNIHKDFIRIGNVLFEKIGNNENVTIYHPLSNLSDNELLNVITTELSIDTDYSVSNLPSTQFSPFKVKVKKVKENVEDILDRCS